MTPAERAIKLHFGSVDKVKMTGVKKLIADKKITTTLGNQMIRLAIAYRKTPAGAKPMPKPDKKKPAVKKPADKPSSKKVKIDLPSLPNKRSKWKIKKGTENDKYAKYEVTIKPKKNETLVDRYYLYSYDYDDKKYVLSDGEYRKNFVY